MIDDAMINRLVEQCVAIKLSGLSNPTRFQFTSSELYKFAKACYAAGQDAQRREDEENGRQKRTNLLDYTNERKSFIEEWEK